MTTDEIEALYVEHKQYFRDVLGSSATADGAIAIIGDELVEIEHTEGRWFSYVPGDGIRPLNASLAVAVMTEAWRELLEKEYKCEFGRGSKGEWLWYGHGTYDSLPEAICAVVERLVAEKREKAKNLSAAETDLSLLKAKIRAFHDLRGRRPTHAAMSRLRCQAIIDLLNNNCNIRPASGHHWLSDLAIEGVTVVVDDQKDSRIWWSDTSRTIRVRDLVAGTCGNFFATETRITVNLGTAEKRAKAKQTSNPGQQGVCPNCGMNMIRRGTGVVLLTYPSQYPWNWWCGCGHTEEGGIEHRVFEPNCQSMWEEANK